MKIKMQKIKKAVPVPKKNISKKDEDEDILLGYIEDVDNKLLKKFSNSKDFNSFINEFDRATNE